jgi:hypothetical protein
MSIEGQEVVMKRIRVASRGTRLRTCLRTCLGACAAAVLGAGIVWAASPQVEQAIKAVEAVGNDPGKLKLFCDLNKLLQGDADDQDTQKQIEDIVGQIGPDFSAAWDVGDELSESSPDGQAFYAAVDSLADKCQ